MIYYEKFPGQACCSFRASICLRVCLQTMLLRASCMHMQCSRHVTKKYSEQHLSLSGKARTCSASAHVADHTTSVADTLNHPLGPALTRTIQSHRLKEKMSFEPKTKVELDPPKDDIISLDYLSKCDGELHSGSYSSTVKSEHLNHRYQPRLPYLRRHQGHCL